MAGGIYEVDKNSSGTVVNTKTYCPAAGAMRVGSTLYYMLKDHLGSASVLTNNSGTIVTGADVRYYPFGEARFSTTPMLTAKLFTGQREITGLGIYHYGARFYSPTLGRFLSADTIVPGYANPQNLNRFSYVTNNPLRYTDPTGHRCVEDGFEGSCTAVENKLTKKWKSDHEAARNRNKKKNDSPTPTAIIATLLDDAAAATNLGYAAVGDIIGLVCAACYLGVVDFYQIYSVIPNSLSTMATGVWIADGEIKGENNLTISQTSQGTNLSLSVSQDTAVSVTTNILGWTVLREPNLATGVDLAVAAYDTAGLGIPGTNIKLPTFVNPTLTYNSGSGFGFSWHRK